MKGTEIQRIGVLGCGLMGSGIAEVCARNGRDVVVVEANAMLVELGKARVEKSLDAALNRGKLTEADHAAALSRLDFTDDWSAFGDRDLIVEAISEDQTLKVDAFRRLDDVVGGTDAILASNTSSIPIMKLATATKRPEQVIGLHFFNPVPVLPLVELVPSLMTNAATSDAVSDFATEVLNKHVIRSQDRAGFVVNALLIPYLLSAIRMLESGFATAADIDAGMVHGCAHPMGPLALADLIGLDTTMAVAESMYAEFKEPLYAPPPLLSRMVEAGLLGRKSGRGFHGYAR
jgi:3-hydroxybutyryl-CoA dehydrogenase